MAEKKAGAKKMNAAAGATTKSTTSASASVKHARIELPEGEYSRLKAAARRRLLPIAAYIRQAVMAAIEEDERKGR